MANKFLFLDIDGILNSINFYKRRGGTNPHKSLFDRHVDELDHVAVDLLKEFVIEHDIKIVISSTWRKLYNVEELQDIFATAGWNDMPIIGCTPSLFKLRGEEIQQWLNSFDGVVEQYLILDDDSDFLQDQIENNFVHVSGETGLLQEHIEQMKTRLRKT